MAQNGLLDGVPSSHLHVLRCIAYALKFTLQSWARTRWSDGPNMRQLRLGKNELGYK